MTKKIIIECDSWVVEDTKVLFEVKEFVVLEVGDRFVYGLNWSGLEENDVGSRKRVFRL